MKNFKLYIILIFLGLSQSSKAQNLVFNGSFEIRDSVFQNSDQQYHDCPYRPDDGIVNYNPQIRIAKGWNNIQGKYLNQWYSSFDFFHSCGNDIANLPYWINSTGVGVPKSKWFMLYQYPRTGEGYTAGLFYGNNTYYTINPGELIQSRLADSLQKDSIYMLSYYVSLGNGSKYSINSQGALLSDNPIMIGDLYAGLMDSSIVPQVINQNGYIEDTLGWVEVSGMFKAKGGEKYITLGGFNIRKGYEKLFNPNANYNIAYYAIEDVSLYPVSAPLDSANCGNDTLICLGNSLTLGKSQVKPEYRNEYSFEWYVSGREDSVFSYDEHPVGTPDSTTTYIVKVIDFKFDKTTDSITVKVVDCTEPTNLFVYPNPTNDIVNFRFNSSITEGMSIDFYDVTGRLVLKNYFHQDYENKEIKINLGNLASGVYVYAVLINNVQKFKGKLIKLK